MKKLVLILSVFVLLFLFPASAYADSPVTSTQFSTAYEDVSIVKKANELGNVNSTIAKYLYDPNNPIDVKAAVINALSWDYNGKSNAETYCKLIYKKSLKDVNINKLRADQQFCIGYMMAMDDYFNTTTALKYLKLAEKNMPNSFTVSIIRSLVETMDMDGNEWNKIEAVLHNSNLKRDMREDAINIILDYMAFYSNNKNIEVSQNNVLIANEGSQIIHLYGTVSINNETPYQIATGSDIAYTSLFKDNYGVYCVKITGVSKGTSSIKINNQYGKSITINFEVVSADAYKMLNNTISLYVGKINAYVNKNETKLDKNTEPYSKNGEAYISVDFICKAVGGTVEYNSKKGSSKFTYGNKTIIFTNGSNKINLNGKTSKLNSKIDIKSKKQYITAKDFAALTDKNYVYDNGLILLSNKKVKISTITDDYILEEIASVVTNSNLLMNTTPFEKNGKYGYEDSKGNVVIKPTFDFAYAFYDGVAVAGYVDVQGNEKYGVIDITGKYVIEPKYEWAGTYAEGLIPLIKDGKAGFVDKKGNIKIPFKFSGAGYFNGGLAPVLNQEGTKWGYIDTYGNLAVPYTYTDCSVFQEGLAAVQIDNKWGYIDRTGKIVIKPIYDEADDFYSGLASVILDGENYDINMSGLLVLYYDNGDIYVGELKSGLYHGKGVYTFADGSQYSGTFIDGKFSGKAIYTWPDGTKYIGDFAEDNYSGKGIFIWPDGSTYKGDFLKGEFNGNGIFTDIDGSIKDGYWQDGVFLGETNQ